jgi:hypothetical protein
MEAVYHDQAKLCCTRANGRKGVDMGNVSETQPHALLMNYVVFVVCFGLGPSKRKEKTKKNLQKGFQW